MKTLNKALKYVFILILAFVFLSEYSHHTPVRVAFSDTEQLAQGTASDRIVQDFDRQSTFQIFAIRSVIEKLATTDYFLERKNRNYLSHLTQFFFKNIYLITVTSLAP